MFRRYEDPRKLQDQLDQWLQDNPKETWDDYDYETYTDLKERINFAWQDEEYDEMHRDPADEQWMEENVYSATDVGDHYFYRISIGSGGAWVDSYVIETDHQTTDYGALVDILIDYMVETGDSHILDPSEYEFTDDGSIHSYYVIDDLCVQGGNAGDVMMHYGLLDIEEIPEDQITENDTIVQEVL